MTKRTTSKKQEFTLKDTPIRRLRPDAPVRRINSATRLRDEELVFRAFWQCLVEQDIQSFKDVLRGHLEAVNKEQFAKISKTSKRRLHRLLSPKGNPTLKNISNVIHALYG